MKLLQRLLWACFALLGNGGDRLGRFIEHNGIVVFVGPNGSGKSLLAVETCLRTLKGEWWDCRDIEHTHNRALLDHVRGYRRVAACETCDAAEERYCEEAEALLAVSGRGERLVYSTLPLLDPTTGKEHRLYRALTDQRQLVTIEHADVLFDEVAGVSDASDSSTMPPAMTRWLQQLRKRDVFLRVTTPAYDRCSKPIRQIATAVVDCRSFFPEASTHGRRWRPRRAMIFEAYDGFAFASFDKNSGDRLKREALGYYWRPSGEAQHSYSTLAQVHALVEVSDAGMCMSCGGTRSRPKCACGEEVEFIPYGELEVVEKVSPAGVRTRHAVQKQQEQLSA